MKLGVYIMDHPILKCENSGIGFIDAAGIFLYAIYPPHLFYC